MLRAHRYLLGAGTAKSLATANLGHAGGRRWLPKAWRERGVSCCSIGSGGSTGPRGVVAAASTSQISQPLWMVCPMPDGCQLSNNSSLLQDLRYDQPKEPSGEINRRTGPFRGWICFTNRHKSEHEALFSHALRHGRFILIMRSLLPPRRTAVPRSRKQAGAPGIVAW
jgi:hypothetical protein